MRGILLVGLVLLTWTEVVRADDCIAILSFPGLHMTRVSISHPEVSAQQQVWEVPNEVAFLLEKKNSPYEFVMQFGSQDITGSFLCNMDIANVRAQNALPELCDVILSLPPESEAPSMTAALLSGDLPVGTVGIPSSSRDLSVSALVDNEYTLEIHQGETISRVGNVFCTANKEQLLEDNIFCKLSVLFDSATIQSLMLTNAMGHVKEQMDIATGDLWKVATARGFSDVVMKLVNGMRVILPSVPCVEEAHTIEIPNVLTSVSGNEESSTAYIITVTPDFNHVKDVEEILVGGVPCIPKASSPSPASLRCLFELQGPSCLGDDVCAIQMAVRTHQDRRIIFVVQEA